MRHNDANPTAVVRLGESIRGEDILELRGRLTDLLDSGRSTLVVDVSRADRLSSATVATLLWTKRRCRQRGVSVVLSGLSKRSSEQLRRAGLADALGCETQPSARFRSPQPEEKS